MTNVNILSFDGQMLSLAITGTSPLKPGSIITGVYNNQPVCVKLPMIPPAPPGQPIMVAVTGASMEEVFEECKYVFRGKMSQLSAMSERLLSPADPMYQSKVTYLRRGMRPSLRAGFTSPITADPSLGDLSLEMENFELDPDVVVDFSTSFGCISQLEIRVDGYAACEVYIKFVASAGVELPAVEGTLLPHQEIPFFVGPVPGTWAREVTASWKLSLQAEAEVKAGTKMRVDFRSGVNYYSETGWGGQLLWRIKNTPIFEASLKGTFTNEAAIEMKNSLKVGGLAGPELTLKPYIKSEALVSTEKPCQVNAALSMGLSGDLKAIVQAWSYNIGEWGGSFEPFGPWVIASHTLSANATPTLKITGPYNLENKLAVKWPNSQDTDPYYPHVYTSTGTDSFALSMDDSKGLYKGLSKVEVSFDGCPAFATFQLDAETHSETGITLIPYPLTATLTMSFPFTIDNHMIDKFGTDEKWYTPFRLPPGPHELMFKVYDKCGDHSIATHAIWVQEEKEIWEIKDSEGNILWELGINGFEKGELPEQGRKIAPVPGGLDLSPLKQGPVKHYMNDGTPHIAGNFQNNTRSGIWNMYQKYFYEDVTGSFTAQIEFDSSGKPVNWLDSDVYLDPSYSDYYIRIQQPTSGSSEFSLKQTDASYLLADFSYGGICSFTTGLRTIGFVAATSSYDIETFVDGARNGSATHHIFESYESTVSLYSGEYANNAKTGRWVIKIFKNLTEPVSTTEGDLSNDLQTGTWTHSSTDAVTSANYLNNVAQGAFSLIWSGGNHVSGSYPVTGSEQWPILNTAGKQVGTYTPQINPIPVAWPEPTAEPDEDWRSVL
ncbi:MAG: hypothetical protein EOM80_12180 [Erysipelotrichia bacterium]|nr:hypothetical protein [Erysipelotrichia bacterium]